MNRDEQLKIVKEFADKLINSQQDQKPEFEKVFRDNFSKLLVNDKNRYKEVKDE